MLVIRRFGVEVRKPLLQGGDDVLAVAAAQLDLGAVTNPVVRFAKQIEQLGNGLAGYGLDPARRGTFVRNPVNAPMDVVAAWVTQVMLQVPDNWILPFQEVNRVIRSNLEIDGTEIGVI